MQNSPLRTRRGQARRERESGSALITLLFFATIITLLAGNIAAMARHKLHFTRIINDRTSAQQIAEGAAAQALAYLAEEPLYITQPPSVVTQGNLGNGTYQVSIESSILDIFTIVSTGSVGEQSRTIKVHCVKPLDLAAFNNAMFSNADINLIGTGTITSGSGDGNIHANHDTGMGGNTSISGNAAAGGTVTVRGNASVGGQQIPGSAKIKFPELNLDDYDKIGEKFIGDLTLQNVTKEPENGVLYVDGDVTINAHVTFKGVLVATGDITQSAHFDHLPTDDRPAMLISKYGNIRLTGQTDMEGLIYAKSGRVEITGGTDLKGAIVAWGDIHASGNWGVISFVEQDPDMDGDNRIQVLAWEM